MKITLTNKNNTTNNYHLCLDNLTVGKILALISLIKRVIPETPVQAEIRTALLKSITNLP